MPSFDLNIMVFDIFPFLNCQKLDLLSYRTFLFLKSKFELSYRFLTISDRFSVGGSENRGFDIEMRIVP